MNNNFRKQQNFSNNDRKGGNAKPFGKPVTVTLKFLAPNPVDRNGNPIEYSNDSLGFLFTTDAYDRFSIPVYADKAILGINGNGSLAVGRLTNVSLTSDNLTVGEVLLLGKNIDLVDIIKNLAVLPKVIVDRDTGAVKCITRFDLIEDSINN